VCVCVCVIGLALCGLTCFPLSRLWAVGAFLIGLLCEAKTFKEVLLRVQRPGTGRALDFRSIRCNLFKS
jgi:hypothetical protein